VSAWRCRSLRSIDCLADQRPDLGAERLLVWRRLIGTRSASCGIEQRVERDAPPAFPARGHERGIDREPVRPRREAAVAAEGLELREHGHHGLLRTVLGEGVEIRGGEMRQAGATPPQREERGPEQILPQLGDGVGLLVPARLEPSEPFRVRPGRAGRR